MAYHELLLKRGNTMDLFEVMYNCRAMRRLQTKEVPEADLIKLIDAANQAPSGSNMQNGRWLIVRDPEVKKGLAALNRAGVEGYIQPMLDNPEGLPHQSVDKRMRMAEAVMWQMEHMHEIPALILACLEFGVKVEGNDILRGAGSIWPGVQNLLLAARAMGLGAAPTTLALLDQDAVRKVVNLPETMAALCLIPVGYPTGKFGPVSRKPVEEIVRFDRWS